MVSFLVAYLNLLFKYSILNTNLPKPRILWCAFLVNILICIVGALLTPLVNALISLKGYSDGKDCLASFGYGLVFGYSMSKLIMSRLYSILVPHEKSEIRAKTKEVANFELFALPSIMEAIDPFPNPTLAPTDAAGMNTNGARFSCSRDRGHDGMEGLT